MLASFRLQSEHSPRGWALPTRAGFTHTGRRQRGKTFIGDHVAALLAAAVLGRGQAVERGVNLGEVAPNPVKHRKDLGALEGDRRTLGIVLVVDVATS